MTLKDKLNSARILALGNRVTLAGYLVGAATTGYVASGHYDRSDAVERGVVLTALEFSTFSIMVTGFGLGTLYRYRKTRKYYEQDCEFNKDRLITQMNSYCNRQGVYLAMNDLGKSDDYKVVFKEFKEKDHWFRIPNF